MAHESQWTGEISEIIYDPVNDIALSVASEADRDR